MPTAETNEVVNTSNNTLLRSSASPDEPGRGILIHDGTLTVRVTAEYTYEYKKVCVCISPVMYHYESNDTEVQPKCTKNHNALAKEADNKATPSCKSERGGSVYLPGTYAVKTVGTLKLTAKCVDETPYQSEVEN